MKIPFLDLTRRTRALRPRLDAAYTRVMNSGRFIKGPEVEGFERSFAGFCGAAHCVGTGNGLDAISLILEAYGIGPGDEVVVPSMTFVATWLGVSRTGATPVPVEPDGRALNITSEGVEKALTSRTRAVVAVHLYGQCAPMGPLRALCDRHGLKLVEDAAQAAGGATGGVRCGALGDAAAFSFYPVKNLGAFGDGGAVTTSDEDLATRVRQLGNYGGLRRGEHEIRGHNSRLDELQAAFLSESLPLLEEYNVARRKTAEHYRQRFKGVEELQVQHVLEGVLPAYHQFVVLSSNRERLQDALAGAGVGTAQHYRLPPHRLPAYAGTCTRALPVADRIASTTLSLPMDPHLSWDEVEYVADQVVRVARTLGS